MNGQIWASPQRGLPVDVTHSSSSAISITNETVLLYYSNSGVRTVDAGQAAGTAVEGKFAHSSILNASGTLLGTKNDSSVSFTCAALDRQVSFESLGITRQQLEATDSMTFANRLSTLTNGMSNGDYAIDYRTGTIYGKKKTTGVSATATSYLIQAPSAEASIIPGRSLEAITKSDTVNFTGGVCRAIYVGGAGDMAVVPPNGSVVTLVGVLAGQIYPVSAIRVNSTNTTATNMVAIF